MTATALPPRPVTEHAAQLAAWLQEHATELAPWRHRATPSTIAPNTSARSPAAATARWTGSRGAAGATSPGALTVAALRSWRQSRTNRRRVGLVIASVFGEVGGAGTSGAKTVKKC